jgi:hypothetical protein
MQTHRAEEWEEGENTTENEIIGKTAKSLDEPQFAIFSAAPR